MDAAAIRRRSIDELPRLGGWLLQLHACTPHGSPMARKNPLVLFQPKPCNIVCIVEQRCGYSFVLPAKFDVQELIAVLAWVVDRNDELLRPHEWLTQEDKEADFPRVGDSAAEPTRSDSDLSKPRLMVDAGIAAFVGRLNKLRKYKIMRTKVNTV